MGHFSQFIFRSIDISGDNWFFEGFRFKADLSSVVSINKLPSCSTVNESEGFDNLIFFCALKNNGNR